jgi:hypothetical protein
LPDSKKKITGIPILRLTLAGFAYRLMLAVGCVEPHQASRRQEEEGRSERVMSKQRKRALFCIHGQNEYPSFISSNIVPDILEFEVFLEE